jgi:hypothetical protein
MLRLALVSLALATAAPVFASAPRSPHSGVAQHHSRGADPYATGAIPLSEVYSRPVPLQDQPPVPSAYNRCGVCGAGGT